MLPNFLVIGSQKAATSSIYEVIKQHPEIYMPEKKELNYFFWDKLYVKGDDYYKRFFKNIPERKTAIGEASPGYICHPTSPKRIKKLIPDVKLILTVRNPYKRAYSQYWDNRRKLHEVNSFNETVNLYLSDDYNRGKGYFSRGVYIKYIERYLQYFKPEQMLVLVFDDLKKDPTTFYKKIFDFLGVENNFDPKNRDKAFNAFSIYNNPAYSFFYHNPSYQKFLPTQLKRFIVIGPQKTFVRPKIDPETKCFLIDFYKPWNKRLSEYLGRDLSFWDN